VILIIGQQYELNINRICEILDYRRVPWVRFNGESYPQDTTASIRLGNGLCDARIETPDGKCARFDQVRAVWARRNGAYAPGPGLHRGRREFLGKECAATVLGLYSMFSHAEWMNDYHAEQIALNKPHQLRIASQCGLTIPDTLITQTPAEARAFYHAHGGNVLTKAIGQSGYVPGDGEERHAEIYANKLSKEDFESLDRVRHAPTMLQAYAEKVLELRVTVVGKRVFATAIESQRSEKTMVDWRRYDNPNTPYYRYRLPDSVSNALILLMRRLSLEYGAIDLVLTPKGEYVFLEVNPGGQWGWVEGMTGHPIDEAIADWLTSRCGMEERDVAWR